MSGADAWREAMPILDEGLCPTCGRDRCEGNCDAAPLARKPSLAVYSACDVMAMPRPAQIIEGIAWSGRVTVLASEPSAGKTFLLLAAGAHVSADLELYGRHVMAGSVVYFAFEADDLGTRLRALRDVAGHVLEHLHVIYASDPLSPVVTRDGEHASIGERDATETVAWLRDELRAAGHPPIVLVIIDTVRASLSGSEDSSEHVSGYLRAVRRMLAAAPGAACVLAHHAGWQDGDAAKKRERGSSAWRGNVDATLYLEVGAHDGARGETELTLRALKTRDAERPAPLHLIRRRVELCESDGHGQPVTSCVIERDRRTREDRDADRTASIDAALREIDLKVLRAMRDYAAATSISRLRPYVGLQTAVVHGSVARLLRAEWAIAGQRGQPYTVTLAGLAALAGDPS